jgi:ELWxxDGT repeat protein
LNRRTAALLLLSLAALPAGAQTASLVKDINPAGGSGSLPTQITAAAGKVFFVAEELNTGSELWESDGTAQGTRLLLDQCPGGCSADYSFLGELHGRLLFTASSGNPSDGLWSTDGTPEGTASLAAGPIFNTAFLGGSLYFSLCPEGQCEIWKTGGTVAGTVRALDLQHAGLVTADARRLFLLLPGANGEDLWGSDGTTAGSSRIAPVPGSFRILTPPGEPLFFAVEGSPTTELWTSDGTAAGTRSIARFRGLPDPREPIHSTGGRIYFAADDGTTGLQVWTSDGTSAGTRPVTRFTVPNIPISRIRRAGARAVFVAPDGFQGDRLWSSQGTPETTAPLPDPCPSCSFVNRNDWLQETGGRVLFFGDDGVHGAEPWITDGTAQGTRLVADLCPGACGSADPLQPVLLPVPQGLLFVATDGTHGQELWRTDGTAAGTARLTDLPASIHLVPRAPSPPFPGQPEAALVGSTAYFSAAAGTAPALWASEKPATTRRVAVIAPQGGSSDPTALTAFGGKLLFMAYNGSSDALWSSEGTAESTVPIGLQAPDQFDPWEPTLAGGLLFLRQSGFDSPPGTNGSLWRTDGTPAGTVRLKEGGVGTGVTAFQGQLYFGSGTIEHPEIWRSDGTPAGTVKAFDVPGGDAGAFYLTGLGPDLYFFDVIRNLWRSDGTPGGTRRLGYVGPTSLQSRPPMVRTGSRAVFLTWVPWATDGTPEGTVPLPVEGGAPGRNSSDLTLFQGSAWFFSGTASNHRGLWRSDGTAAGTVLVKEFPGLDAASETPLSMTAIGGRLWFAADDGLHGYEPWTSDGTAAGTAMVKDIIPGRDGSLPSRFTAAGERVFFKATDGEHGFELWQSDGTAAGTRMVQDIAPLAGSSHPDQLTVVGDRLFFAANDGPSGRELWTLPLSGPAGCQPADTVLCLGGRYRVEARWRDFQGNSGSGHAVPLTADTGTFWFFAPSNVEAIVKILDGRGVNGHVWVFYGALSNVEYTLTVTDTQTGLSRQYFNPSGQLASVGDVYGFGPRGANGANPQPPITTAAPSPLPLIAERTDRAATVPCQPGAQRLCLSGGRFAVDVAWKDFQGHTGKGTAVPLTADTGTFWFFNASNVELVVKALDGRPVNGHFWLFYGALSNVQYTVTVTDTQTGKMRTYTNPSGRFASVADTLAF